METERCPFNGVDCEYIPLSRKVEEQVKEIERLREALEKAQCGCEAPCLHGQYCSSWIAQIALKEKE